MPTFGLEGTALTEHRAAPSCVSYFRLILSHVTVYCLLSVDSLAAQGWKRVFSFHTQVRVYICSANPVSGKAFCVSYGKETVMNFLCFSVPGKFFTSSSLKYKYLVYRNLGGFFFTLFFILAYCCLYKSGWNLCLKS